LKRKVHPGPNTGNAVTAKAPSPVLRGMKMAGAAPVYLEMSVGIEMSVTLLASVVPAVLDPGPTASSLGEDDDIDDAEGRIG
jgi:nitrous oxidase accessory protein NosD